MGGWRFTHGREGEQVVEEVTAAGATRIALAGADGIFAPGQLLFVSEADGAETQWLGKVMAADNEGVDFSCPLAISKNTGALLWRAASVIQTPAEAARPLRRRMVPGVAVARSAGGQVYAVATAAPRETTRLELAGLTPHTGRELLAWLADVAGWGLDPFTIIDPAGEPLAARLSGEPIECDEDAGGRWRLVLPLILGEEGLIQ